MSDELRIIAYKAEVALLELRELLQTGPDLRIVHRFWQPGTECLPGEEVWAVFLVLRGREVRLPLSLAVRLLLNYLAETKHIPQSATQIVAGMRRSDFYARHGSYSGVPSRRKISRSAVKEYIKRLRMALNVAFREAALGLDPKHVLVSRKTTGNEIQYQLRAAIQWVHVADDHSLGIG